MEAEGVLLKLLCCLLSATVSLFIKKCMESGMILRRYYLYLTFFWVKWHRKHDRFKRNFLKPAGLCVYCYSFWVFAAIFAVNGFFIGILLYSGINYIMLETCLTLQKRGC